jgi:5-methyltetrahydropteroyltriglutamate--homocysteine methyltransferase
MITHNLGYPRIGTGRELKKACENYWAEKITAEELMSTGKELRASNWKLQKEAGIDLVPSNDFSFYDHVLDMAMSLGAIPVRFKCLQNYLSAEPIELYFALARGYQKDGFDIPAMELTKWFDTNYHYLVPEFYRGQKFSQLSEKITKEFIEAKELNILTKPVLIGPVSFLMLGKARDKSFNKLDLLNDILPVYSDIISDLVANGAQWIQFDEPALSTELTERARESVRLTYNAFRNEFPGLRILVATYFDGLTDNADLAASLPVDALHLDLVRSPEQLGRILEILPEKLTLSLGIVDGRNIWKNDYAKSLRIIRGVVEKTGPDRVMIAPSCSLMHVPIDLELETDGRSLPAEIRGWMAFANQKLSEVNELRLLSGNIINDISDNLSLYNNQQAIESRKASGRIHNEEVKRQIENVSFLEATKKSDFKTRKTLQQKKLNVPLFPTTSIGSFPQTSEVRSWRSRLKKGEITHDEYVTLIKNEISNAIRWQEKAGLDVLVHGEFERNDMVEYFGEMLEGFAFTRNGWIQSYGSRCVKPPVIYGDVRRVEPMTTGWIKYAQSLTSRPVKGMLTGPVTMVLWSFVRDDQPVSETTLQIALALRNEVLDLEKEGISVIQIDEPALREGLPLNRSNREAYLNQAVRAFRLTYAGTRDETQIHTHMCYSEFNDIVEYIASMDADVITIESSRSQMELLDAFAEFKYPNDIGPGVYDIHSPRIPSTTEIIDLLKRALMVIPAEQLWVNPDCGLKTRSWEETKGAITNMVAAAKLMKLKYAVHAR